MKKQNLIFLILVSVMIFSLLLFQGRSTLKNHRDFHDRLVKGAVLSSSNEISLLVRELRRSLHLFADRESELISKLSNNPTDSSLFIQLKPKVETHFPEHFAFTVANKEGESLLAKTDRLVGNGCRKDLKAFSSNLDTHRLYIHSSPNSKPYHFDIMVPWVYDDENRGVFFVSFNLKTLTRMLKNDQPENHSFFLTKTDKHVIELTAKGSFYELARYPNEVEKLVRIQLNPIKSDER